MNRTVQDFMNPKLVYLRDGDRPEVALQPILDFGITAVPVLDELHRPVGVVSLRDIVGRAGRRESETVLTIRANASLASAASQLAEANVHHLVVVDGEARAVGILSALDVLRGLIGLDPKHPGAIEAFAPATSPTRL